MGGTSGVPWGEAANNVQGLSQSSREQGQHLQKRSLGAQEAALWQAPPVPLVSSGDADAGSASLESPALEDPTQPRAQLSKQAFLPRKLKELDGSPMAPRPGGGAAHTNAVGGGGSVQPKPPLSPLHMLRAQGLGAGPRGSPGHGDQSSEDQSKMLSSQSVQTPSAPPTLPVWLRAKPSPNATRAPLGCPGDVMDRLWAPAASDGSGHQHRRQAPSASSCTRGVPS